MKWYSAYTRIIWIILTAIVIWVIARPSPAGLDKFERIGRLIETAGGKILILALMAMLFFVAAMGFAYYVLDGIQNHTLQADDVMANMIVQFTTGSAFGTAIGALVSLLGAKGENKP